MATGTERGTRMKISLLRGRAYAYFQNADFEKSKKVLDEINSTQEFQELDILLLMAECDLHLGRRSADKCIDRLHETILSCNEFKSCDIESWGDELKKNGRMVGSILLYWIASDKYRTEATNQNDLITYIKRRAGDIQDVAKVLAKSGARLRVIVTDYVIEFLTKMLDNVRNATGTDIDAKTLMEGGCLNSVVCVCNNINDYQESIRFGSIGIDILEEQFGANASKYHIYGYLLSNLGNAYHKSGRYTEAEVFFVKSIEAYGKATDFSDENVKQKLAKKLIETAKTNLNKTRKHLLQRK